ncbi:MAG: HIT family protein [Chloroflexota bacterium]|nr:HIT family protein [Chloroflexota bacterium]MDE2929501.1 HIT family protein [Chloroflexota bacterium]
MKRTHIDIQRYVERAQRGPCFICEMLAGRKPHHIIYEDDRHVVFLNKYPTLYGYALVAPRDHREHVIGGFSMEEYLAMQKLIYAVAEAIKKVVPAERVYILSLGSQQGNSHVHWHIAPLPPGVPYGEQQYEALRAENGILEISYGEMAALAARIRGAMDIG